LLDVRAGEGVERGRGDAIDRYFSREADRDLAENPDARTYSMSEVVAAIFGEETGQSVA
jgi:hypothetical protein